MTAVDEMFNNRARTLALKFAGIGENFADAGCPRTHRSLEMNRVAVSAIMAMQRQESYSSNMR